MAEPGRQTPPQSPLAMAQSVAVRANLKSIRTLQGLFEGQAEDSGIDEGLRLGFAHEMKDGDLVAEVLVELRSQIPLESKEYLHVVVAFRLEYGIAEGPEIPSEALEAFAKINGTYNAWPYWREFLQNAANRMGLRLPPMFLLTAEAAMELAGYEREAAEEGDGVE